jgi:hypothetical protein
MGVMTTSSLFGNDEEPKKENAPTRHHPSLSPSSFPSMSTCPCYVSKKDASGAALERGNKLHQQLSEILMSYEV